MTTEQPGRMHLIQAISRSWTLSSFELENLLDYSSETDDIEVDRLRIVYSIHAVLASLFVNHGDEARWVRGQLPILGNISPLEYMLRNRIPGMLRVQEIVERGMTNH